MSVCLLNTEIVLRSFLENVGSIIGPQITDIIDTLVALAGVEIVHLATTYVFAGDWAPIVRTGINWTEGAAAASITINYLVSSAYYVIVTRWRRVMTEAK